MKILTFFPHYYYLFYQLKYIWLSWQKVFCMFHRQNTCSIAWWQLWNFMVWKLKFKRCLHQDAMNILTEIFDISLKIFVESQQRQYILTKWNWMKMIKTKDVGTKIFSSNLIFWYNNHFEDNYVDFWPLKLTFKSRK